MNNIRTSIIIPTYNKSARLKLTLKSIQNLVVDRGIEFIFVNDGSTDNTDEILKQFEQDNRSRLNVKKLLIKNFGRSGARNAGLKEARGELIIFTDDDVILHPQFVINHETAHSNDKDLAVHGRINSLPYLKFFKNPMTGEFYDNRIAEGHLKTKTIQPEMFEKNQINKYLTQNSRLSKFEKDIQSLFEDTTIYDSNFRWIGFTGGNISISRSKIEQVGGFDEMLGKKWGCEDFETGYRLSLLGVKFVYNEKAINYHMDHFRKDSGNLHDIAIDYFFDKHKDKKISILKSYFRNEIDSLIEWKNICDNEGACHESFRKSRC